MTASGVSPRTLWFRYFGSVAGKLLRCLVHPVIYYWFCLEDYGRDFCFYLGKSTDCATSERDVTPLKTLRMPSCAIVR